MFFLSFFFYCVYASKARIIGHLKKDQSSKKIILDHCNKMLYGSVQSAAYKNNASDKNQWLNLNKIK